MVPTYNYLAVHALRAAADPRRRRMAARDGTRLTQRFEAPRATPWQVTDAPADFIEKQLRAIVGIEIRSPD